MYKVKAPFTSPDIKEVIWRSKLSFLCIVISYNHVIFFGQGNNSLKDYIDWMLVMYHKYVFTFECIYVIYLMQ